MAQQSALPATTAARRAPMPVLLAFVLTALAGWVGVAPTVARADGPTSFANLAAIAVPATGSANQIGPASPYPSSITVSGMSGAVTKVTVTLSGVTHSTLNDMDVLVVAPGGANLVLLSDIGDPETTLAFANNATLTFDDAAANQVTSGNVPTGSYRPTNSSPAADPFPAPAPAPSGDTTLGQAFTGLANANGAWLLYVVDDATGDVGQIAGGWSVTITTAVSAVSTTTTVASSDPSSFTGEPVAFTATVRAGGSPVTAGTVQFADGATNLGAPVALNASGQATVTAGALTEGSHVIRATYNGATGFLGSNGTVTQRVDNRTQVTGRTFCNPGTITVPQAGQAVPYPSNIFVSGLSGELTKVTATLNDLSHQAPIDLDVLLSGPSPTTNLFLLSDAGGQNPVSNLNLTFDDAAAAGVGAPATSGTFKPTRAADESTEALPAPAPVASSATALSTFDGSNPNGTWSLWAFDDASGDTGSISGGWCLTVESAVATTTSLTAAPNPATEGQAVTLTAAVSAGADPAPGGTVTFFDGPATLATVPVDPQGRATLTTSSLSVRSHQIRADYAGTDEFEPSSDSVTVVVQLQSTATTLTVAPNPAAVGSEVTFTASVTAGAAPVGTGSVTFSVDGTAGTPVPVDAQGQATFSTAALTIGTHEITAGYSGATGFAASTSDPVDLVVEQVASTTTLTAVPNPVTQGEQVTLTATVTAAGNPATAGTVTFTDGGTPLGAAVPVDAQGQAVLSISTLSVGDHSIGANYGGTATTAPSNDSVTVVVEAVVILVGGPYEIAEGDSLTLAGSGPGGDSGYAWDLNDDGDFADATGKVPTLTWDDLQALGIDDGPAVHTIRFRGTFAGGVTVTESSGLTVTNTAPRSVLTGELTATVDVPFTIKVGADDPSAADMADDFTYTVDWGDGSPVESVVGPADPPVTHTYTQAGNYSATFAAEDRDGGVGGGNTVTVQVAAVPDDEDPDDPADGGDDDPLPQSGSAADPGVIALAAVLITGGVATLVIARRRRRD